MKKAIILIDYTKDFVADDGKLTCGAPGQAIDKNIARYLNSVSGNKDYIVVVANDLHYVGDTTHPESKLFPEHNIKGTEGRELYGVTGEIIKAYANGENTRDQLYLMDKCRYSAFAYGTDLESILETNKVEQLILMGVCTDICVLHTAVDAYNKGYDVVIPSDCVASFNPTGHEWALGHFKNTLGFTVE